MGKLSANCALKSDTEADKLSSFGAVLEEFEVQDALEGVLAEKQVPAQEQHFSLPQVPAVT